MVADIFDPASLYDRTILGSEATHDDSSQEFPPESLCSGMVDTYELEVVHPNLQVPDHHVDAEVHKKPAASPKPGLAVKAATKQVAKQKAVASQRKVKAVVKHISKKPAASSQRKVKAIAKTEAKAIDKTNPTKVKAIDKREVKAIAKTQPKQVKATAIDKRTAKAIDKTKPPKVKAIAKKTESPTTAKKPAAATGYESEGPDWRFKGVPLIADGRFGIEDVHIMDVLNLEMTNYAVSSRVASELALAVYDFTARKFFDPDDGMMIYEIKTADFVREMTASEAAVAYEITGHPVA